MVVGPGEGAMQRETLRILAVLVILAVSSAGCRGGGETSCADGGTCTGGSFTANLTGEGGAAIDSFAGKACQCLIGDAATGDWSLGLVDTNGVDAIVIGREIGGRPRLGTTPLLASASGHSELALRARLSFSAGLWTCSTGSDGALVASVASDDAVNGTFSVGVLCTLPGGQAGGGLLTATFQAVKGPVTTIP